MWSRFNGRRRGKVTGTRRLHSRRRPARFVESLEARVVLASTVVINEIHYDPDLKAENVEFVELYNDSASSVDLSHWFFSDGMTYNFPVGTTLDPHGYLVVAQDPAALLAKFNAVALGPWTGKLSNDGDSVVLHDSSGAIADRVDYGVGFPWPIVGDPPGYSIELINPALDNNLGGSWRTSSPERLNPQTLIGPAAQWKYFKGATEASTPTSAWRQTDFDDAAWLSGATPIGYDPGGLKINTTLADMRKAGVNVGYNSVFLRKEFTVGDPSTIGALFLDAKYDDGFNAYLNGVWVAGRNMPSQNVAFNANASLDKENVTAETFTFANRGGLLRAGKNVLAVQFNNVAITNTDAYFEAQLTSASTPPPTPSPGVRNSVFAANAPPQMRQVEHFPQQPQGGQAVRITAKITDPNGVANVNLQYQLVDPGNYIELTDPAYLTSWTTVAMRDDGLSGDVQAGDDVYTVIMPPELQLHRRLVRYRVTSVDTLGASVTGPLPDDTQPNFAYYVYNGVPAWSGAIDPKSTDPVKKAVVTYGETVMNSLPVYQLLTKRQSHVDSQFIPNSTRTAGYDGDVYLWTGTFIFNGQVYDHIHYRARGGVWRYAMGKNMWKFDFNHGHDFEPVDMFGKPLGVKWTKLNLGANIQQGNFGQRGEQGLFEGVGFRLFNFAGAPSPVTNYAQFRIVDGVNESGPTQYDGDFQGLYLTVEQPDGRLLENHGLPDGNLYKMENGTGDANNLGPTGPFDKSDLTAFQAGLAASSPSEQWVRDNIDLESYYGYRAMVEAVHHWDIGFGKNYFFYRNPENGKWSTVAWDLDLTWTTTYEPGGGDAEPLKKILNRPVFRTEYRNRVREIRDLLFNSEQVGQMLDEQAALIDGPQWNGASMAYADRAKWDYNPIMTSKYINTDKANVGRFYATANPKTFAGFVQKLKDYVVTRGKYLDSTVITTAEETAAPKKTTLTYAGPAGFATNQLRFSSTGFVAGGSGGTFTGMQWRLAEVTDPTAPAYDPAAPKHYEIDAVWDSGKLAAFADTVDLPAGVAQPGHAYRARVRVLDSNGRWSHWSDPVQFIAGASTAPLPQLRITELNYNPYLGPGFGADQFEFIEVANLGSATANLANVKLTGGVEYTFGNQDLAPGARIVVVNNLAAFRSRYGDAIATAPGVYQGTLSNSGERIELLDSSARALQTFDYRDSGAWPSRADGKGSTLEIVNPLGDAADPLNWRSSSEYGGSPGVAGAGPVRSLVINEVVSHGAAGQHQSIELHNVSSAPLDIGGWYLSDSSDNYKKFRIPAGTVLAAGAYAIFDDNQFNAPGAPGAFSLDGFSAGDLWLLSANAGGALLQFVDHAEFGPAAAGQALGRWPNGVGGFYPMTALSLGSVNPGPALGPIEISEVMYSPAPALDDLEFVELYNRTNQSVSLDGWKLRGGVDFDFPLGTTVGPYATLVIAHFDPRNPDHGLRLEAFRAAYHIDASVSIVGPALGTWNNAGDVVRLLRPGDPSSAVPPVVPSLWVDEVDFSAAAPWPAEAGGAGLALRRLNRTAFGNDSASWGADLATPGANPIVVVNPTDAGLGSLREAIRDANDALGKSEAIEFKIPGALTHEIELATPLPGLVEAESLSIPLGQEILLGTATPIALGDFSQLTQQGGGTLTLGGHATRVQPGAYVVEAGALRIAGDVGADFHVTVRGNAKLLVAGQRSVAGVDLRQGGSARIEGDASSLSLQHLAIASASGSQFDLGRGALVVETGAGSPTLSELESLIALGRRATAPFWTGAGITSLAAQSDETQLTAVGIVDNQRFRYTSLLGSHFGRGEPGAVPLPAAALLLKYVYAGDANVDGVVDGTDYALTDNGYNFGLPHWSNGDFDYGGTVDGLDYAQLDNGYNFQGQPLRGQPAAAPVMPRVLLTAESSSPSTGLAVVDNDLALAVGIAVASAAQPGPAAAGPIAAGQDQTGPPHRAEPAAVVAAWRASAVDAALDEWSGDASDELELTGSAPPEVESLNDLLSAQVLDSFS